MYFLPKRTHMLNFKKFLVLAIFFPLAAYSQDETKESTLTCRVWVYSKSDSLPLAAAGILVKNKSQTAITGENGDASLTFLVSDSILLVTREGYLPEEVNAVAKADGQTTVELKVFLAPEAKATDRGLGLAYPCRVFPGSFSGIQPNFQQGHWPSFEQALQGQVAGVHTISSTGNLNSYTSILMRGVGTSVLGTEPMVVVDGVPVTSGSLGDGGGGIGINFGYNTSPLADLNVTDIQQVLVHKPGSATALYGGRGANGVIEILTKRGVPGKDKLQVDFQTGISTPTHKLALLDGPGYNRALDDAVSRSFFYNPDNAGKALPGRDQYVQTSSNPFMTEEVARSTNVNPLDRVFRNGSYQQLGLSASGGNKLVRFYFGGNYLSQKGIQRNNDNNRLSIRFNTDIHLNDQFKFGSSLYFALNQGFIQPSGLNLFGGGFGEAQTTALPINPYRFDSRNNNLNPYAAFNPYFNAYDGSNMALLTDPSHARYERQGFRSIGNVFGEWKVKQVEGLRLRGNFAFDYHSNFDRTFQSRFARLGLEVNAIGDTVLVPSSKASDYRSVFFNLSYQALADYTRAIDQHHFRLHASTAYQQVTNEFNGISSENFPSSFSKLVSFGSRFSDRPIGAEAGFAFATYTTGLDYNFDQKYFVSLANAWTASTRYGSQTGFEPFPSLSLGWDITKESFFPELSWLNQLYVHGASSVVGNSLMTNTQARGYWRGPLPYVDLGTFPGRFPYSLPSLNLAPERNWVNEVELRSSLWNNKVQATLGYFHRLTTNAIQFYPFPPSQGMGAEFFTQNGAGIRNQGIEAAFSASVLKTGKVEWITGLNVATLQHELTSADGLQAEQAQGFANTRSIEGLGTSAIYLPRWGGFATADDPAGKWRKGDELIYDREGRLFKPQTLGQIDSAAVVINKSALPKFYGGFTNVVKFGRFTADALITFSLGNYLLDAGERYQSYMTGLSNLRESAVDQNLYYLGEGDSTRIYTNLLSQRNTTRFLHNASYLRLKNVGLSYELNTKSGLMSKVAAATIFFRMQNILTVTQFKGWDPEALINTPMTNNRVHGLGQTFFDLPQSRTFLVGLTVTL